MRKITLRWYNENFKEMVYEDTVWNITTTYIGRAQYFETEESKRFKAATDTARPIWAITKIVEDTTGPKITKWFLPVDTNWNPSNKAEFAWDDILTLTYL